MWRLLFAFRTGGFHFRKQSPIGPYVVDMACHHARLAIEIDGDTHGTDAAQRSDAVRDAFLQSQGYEVLRFSNAEILHNPEGVFSVVAAALRGKQKSRRAAHPLPNPPHKGEGVPPVGGQEGAPNPLFTSPPVGEAGRGVSHTHQRRATPSRDNGNA